jgi:peptidoglycan hydrolase CwlO-like protein
MFISKSEKLHIHERLDAIGMGLVETSEKANAASAAADKAHESIPNIRKTNKTLMDNIWNLDAKIDGLNAKIESLNTKVVNLQSTATLVTGLAEQSRTMGMRISELEVANKTFTKNFQSVFSSVAALERRKPIGRPPKKLVIPPESVQALKDSGVWDDPIRRVGFIDQLIKDEQEKKVITQKEKQREYSRKYNQRKREERLAEKLAKEAA